MVAEHARPVSIGLPCVLHRGQRTWLPENQTLHARCSCQSDPYTQIALKWCVYPRQRILFWFAMQVFVATGQPNCQYSCQTGPAGLVDQVSSTLCSVPRMPGPQCCLVLACCPTACFICLNITSTPLMYQATSPPVNSYLHSCTVAATHQAARYWLHRYTAVPFTSRVGQYYGLRRESPHFLWTCCMPFLLV